MWKLCSSRSERERENARTGERENGKAGSSERGAEKMYDFWTPIFFEEKTQRTKTYIEAPLSGAKPHSTMRSITLHGGAILSDCTSNHSSGARVA